MNNITVPLHSKIHNWMEAFGFRLSSSQTNRNRKITTNHYFFETFNFFEKKDVKNPENSKFVCFNAYGQEINVNSLLDLQNAFFENISQLK